MGVLTVPQMFEVMVLHGAARARKYIELSNRAVETSIATKTYWSLCRALFADFALGRALSREAARSIEIMADRWDFSPDAVYQVVYEYGMGGVGSPSIEEDFFLDLWARREIAVIKGWPLDQLAPEWEDWVNRFSVSLSERKQNRQTPPALPRPQIKKTGGFDRSAPFPEEVPF